MLVMGILCLSCATHLFCSLLWVFCSLLWVFWSLYPSATTGVAHACIGPITRQGAPLESMSTGSQQFGCCEKGILELSQARMCLE